MNFNTLPEEQDNLELINRLQDFHRLAPEDRASLASIERRLFAVAPPQLQERTPAEPEETFMKGFTTRHETIFSEELSQLEPLFSEQPRSQKVWARRLELFAAVLVVVLLIGASVSAFVLIQGKNRSTIGGKTSVPTHTIGTVQPTSTSTVPLPLVPGETRTLLGGGASLYSESFFMATAQVGWSRQYQSGGLNAGPILRTTDGGKHWQLVTLPQELSGQSFNAYAFDANMAFVVPLADQLTPQSYLYRTLDGGATWQRGTLPAFPQSNMNHTELNWSFLDHQEGWMTVQMVPCCGGDSHGETLAELGGETLYHTKDGGLTWLKVVSLSVKYPAGGLTFINAQTGWLSTYVDDPAHPSLSDPLSFPAAVYTTHNGGYTWQQEQSFPVPSQTLTRPGAYSLDFFSASKGYLFDYVSRSNMSDPVFLYVTQDGGNSWQMLGSSIYASGTGLSVVNDSYVFDSMMTLFTLRNGQWVVVSKPPSFATPTSEHFSSVEYLSSLTGLALTNSGDVYQTSDGGQTWQNIGTLPAK